LIVVPGPLPASPRRFLLLAKAGNAAAVRQGRQRRGIAAAADEQIG
jgi:hypothetical protein